MSKLSLKRIVSRGILGIALGMTFVGSPVWSKSPWQWVSFRTSSEDKNTSHKLTEDAGPWLIYAASFAGEGAEAEARQLADELQSKYKMRTYVHSQQFNFSETVQGIGVNQDLTPKKMRYDKDGIFDEIAVLVGDYESFDDPNLAEGLKKIKFLKPECLTKSGEKTTRRYAGLREWHKRVNGDKVKQQKGPMGSAFATRNPLIPREFFAPKGVDTFVLGMNEGVEHSLLECDGEFTVRVATFRGNVIIDQRQVAEIERGDGKMKSRLGEAALRAHKLTAALRKKGVEAYEFHDRHESIVTVGSYDWVGRPREDGVQEMNPAIVSTIQKFAPTQKPLQGNEGQSLAGLQPRTLDGISFDIQPWPVEVPKRSVATDYAPRN